MPRCRSTCRPGAGPDAPHRFAMALLVVLSLTAPSLAEESPPPETEGADIWRIENDHGPPVFTDQPGDLPADRVELKRLNVLDLPVPTPAPDVDTVGDEPRLAEDDAEADGYEVRLLRPEDEAAIRANAGTVTLVAAVEPRLVPGHQLQLLLDGEPRGTRDDGTFRLENLDRGEHTATARVLDAGGEEIARSESVTFYVLRASRLNP